jgi:hypothetical protein
LPGRSGAAAEREQGKPPPSGDGLLAISLPPQTPSSAPAARTVGHVPHEPLDPFAGDPDDPAAELSIDGDEPVTLSAEEREELVEDLAELEGFRALLEPRGVLGIVVDCADCGEQHYMDWDLMAGNLRSLLTLGRTRVHEPAFAPDPDRYVPWEYARGFADAVLEAAEDELDDPTGR